MFIYKWLKGLFSNTINNMENPSKVQAKINELNILSSGGVGHPIISQWQAIIGYVALTNVSLNGQTATFNPTVGFPSKAFLNIRTGEIKIYSAYLFEN